LNTLLLLVEAVAQLALILRVAGVAVLAVY
jgi:hypothetical protein